MLEVAVGDLAEAVVRRVERFLHRIDGARIAEAGEQDQRLEPDVAVSVLARRLQQRRHGDGAGSPPDGATGLHPGGIVEVTQLRDGGLEIRR